MTRQQAQERHADLLAAIGATSEGAGHRRARRALRLQARRTAQRYAWLRRVSQT